MAWRLRGLVEETGRQEQVRSECPHHKNSLVDIDLRLAEIEGTFKACRPSSHQDSRYNTHFQGMGWRCGELCKLSTTRKLTV